MNEFIDGKRVMHIDTSSKLYENKDTGIAYRIVKSDAHKGLALSRRLKKELKRDLDADQDYPRIYAICIYYLIKDDLNLFDTLVICGDENYSYVRQYLDMLFEDSEAYMLKKILSVCELRDLTGDKKLKSYANNIANSYRKRALKPIYRQQKGTPLNKIRIGYKEIREKWLKIDERLKKISVSGE